MYNIIYETSHQSRFDAQYWMPGAGALGRPRGMVRGGRREEGSGWGTRVYLWWIHVDIWQNQYNILKLKNKILKKNHTHIWLISFCLKQWFLTGGLILTPKGHLNGHVWRWLELSQLGVCAPGVSRWKPGMLRKAQHSSS